MSFNKRRSPTLAGICDFNNLYIREHNANINTKNYLLSKPPMSYRDLRLVVSNRIPSNLLLSTKTSIATPILYQQQQQQKKEQHKKMIKQTGFDVYRSLARSMSHYSPNSERDLINDDITLLTNSLAIDRLSPLSNTAYFRTNNLPKIQKNYQTNYEQNENIRSTSPEISHRTTPINQYYEDNNEKITIKPTRVLTCMSKNRTRKQLHVYMPSINC